MKSTKPTHLPREFAVKVVVDDSKTSTKNWFGGPNFIRNKTFGRAKVGGSKKVDHKRPYHYLMWSLSQALKTRKVHSHATT